MPLSVEIQTFLHFFTLSIDEIRRKYSQLLQQLGWNWNDNWHLIQNSKLAIMQFESNEQFYQYMSILSNNITMDYYPLFLQIMDILNIENGELDNKLSDLFLGNSFIHTGCAEFHT